MAQNPEHRGARHSGICAKCASGPIATAEQYAGACLTLYNAVDMLEFDRENPTICGNIHQRIDKSSHSNTLLHSASHPEYRRTRSHRQHLMISFYPFKRSVLGRHVTLSGEFKNLRVALISDDLTSLCLSYECQVRAVSPRNYKWVLKYWRPDILLAESAWCGKDNSWKFKIASYNQHPNRNNDELRRVVSYARELGIPSVFWNKEDAVHFDRFIDSAALFDYVFTVDENAIPRYREALGTDARVATLMFSIQPALHAPMEGAYRYSRACFVGSYSHHIHPRRRMWQDMLFESAREIGLTVYDRNSDRRSEVYRYPTRPWIELRTKIDHRRTAQIYREHMVCLNVNTIEDSATMFSRRFLEILASGGLAVSTPALSIRRLFADFCHMVSTEEEMNELFDSLRNGWRPADHDMVRSASEYVVKHHTWEKRLSEILEIVPIGKAH